MREMTKEEMLEFIRVMKPYLDKYGPKEPCTNSGDPGEACDCCDEIPTEE